MGVLCDLKECPGKKLATSDTNRHRVNMVNIFQVYINYKTLIINGMKFKKGLNRQKHVNHEF
jgi:hypothetical protein